jgi:hypothetical protein
MSESLSLYRQFLRLRHKFPSRGIRTSLRVTTQSLFRAQRARYLAIADRSDWTEANRLGDIWRKEAGDDLGKLLLSPDMCV